MGNRRVYGLGVNDMPRGWTMLSDLNFRIYDLWRHVILRTTEKFWAKYPTYSGTTVCDEWLVLSNFVRDIQECDGYEFWKNNPGQQIMFDKDVKVPGNKHYCKDKCSFISHTESNRDVYERNPDVVRKASAAFADKYGMRINAIEVNTGDVIVFDSQKEAGRKLGINQSNIWMVMSDDPKYSSNKTVYSSDGRRWTFERAQ